jgi:hypothetical protein
MKIVVPVGPPSLPPAAMTSGFSRFQVTIDSSNASSATALDPTTSGNLVGIWVCQWKRLQMCCRPKVPFLLPSFHFFAVMAFDTSIHSGYC